MYNLILEGKIIPEESTLSMRIYEEYLVDKFKPEDKKIKLKPIKNDSDAFRTLFKNDREPIRGSNLTTNYRYFYERIQKNEITIDQLFKAIKSLEVINIKLDNDDNPQLIFESLNSTGLDLSEGDKIRNFILMGQPAEKQENLYENYWDIIEKNTKYQMDLFIRDYLSVKTQSTAPFSKIYINFKDYVENNIIETEELLKDLRKYSEFYNILLWDIPSNEDIKSCIFRLNRLETTVTRPFFLEILRLNKEGILAQDETSEIFHTIENYIFRRTICDLPSNVMNRLMVALHKEIVKLDDTTDNYLEKFKYVLLSKKDKSRFPLDAEFKSSLESKQVYSMNSKNRVYIMERYENFGTREDKSVYEHIDDGIYSIEHIMPQKLTKAWADSLGEDYKQIHDKWLHRLANLTLTAYNSTYSNRTFIEKRDMNKGFRDSGLRMNVKLLSFNEWTERELLTRNTEMLEKAVKIWRYPETEYVPVIKPLDSFTLDDEFDARGLKIAGFSFENIEQPVRSWAEMYTSVTNFLYSEDSTIIDNIAFNEFHKEDFKSFISSDSNSLNNPAMIQNGIYVELNNRTESKLNILRKLFKLYNIENSDLIFSINTDSEDIPEGSRFQKRIEFWEYALEYLRKANIENGMFENVTPSKDNWINGYFGISRFFISCVANFDSTRVELSFSKTDDSENKRAFDYLYKFKNEIEKNIGTELIWKRYEDKKTKKIYYQINGRGISNRADWNFISEFMAEWSFKLYKHIVEPYLIDTWK